MYGRRYRSSVNLGSNAFPYILCPSQLTSSLLRSIFFKLNGFVSKEPLNASLLTMPMNRRLGSWPWKR